MKKYLFDIAMILLMAGLLVLLNELGLLEEYAKFGVIPLLVFYFLGKYSQRKFG